MNLIKMPFSRENESRVVRWWRFGKIFHFASKKLKFSTFFGILFQVDDIPIFKKKYEIFYWLHSRQPPTNFIHSTFLFFLKF